jgi:hypothetical protein
MRNLHLLSDPAFDYMPYDVYTSFTLGILELRSNVAAIIGNVDAEWVLCGLTSIGDRNVKVMLKNAYGRGLAAERVFIDNFTGSLARTAPMGTYNYPVYPKNGLILFDLEESGGFADSNQILFWGYKRYRKGDRVC